MCKATKRAVAAGFFCLLACSVAMAGGTPVPGSLTPVDTHAKPASDNPFATVFLVTSKATFDEGLETFAKAPIARRGALGQKLVIAQVRAHQLTEFSRHIHDTEGRCGGYFAFATLAEAERFVREDASIVATSAKFLPDYTIDNQRNVDAWLPAVSEVNIRSTITHLSTAYPNRYYASTHGRNSALWIRDQWMNIAGRRTDVRAELFNDCSNCGVQPSVILTIEGNELKDEIVVLGAHLDSISSTGSGEYMNAPGADDDASGIATLTEVLRVLMDKHYRPKRTVMFMGYAAEEVGLRGSRAIAQRFAAEGRNVVGVLQMDMTNYRAAGSTSDVRVMSDNSNATLVQFLRGIFSTYMAPLGYTLGTSSCGYACSDHASWTAAGFPAGMYDEGPFFPSLHTPNDRLENMGNNAQHATIIARLGLAFVGELGKNSAKRSKSNLPVDVSGARRYQPKSPLPAVPLLAPGKNSKQRP